MKSLRFLVPLAVALMLIGSARADTDNEMSGLELNLRSLLDPPAASSLDPTEGAIEQAVGFYAKGSLINPTQFPLSGPGFMKVFIPRSRFWTTFDMSVIIQSVAEKLAEEYPDLERLQIADMSAHDGGPIGAHDSHQNGLDADVIYLRSNHYEQDPYKVTDWAESFVHAGHVTTNFDIERNLRLASLFVATGRINRMFVDTAVKRDLCAYVTGRGAVDEYTEVLHRLRIWPDHDTHVHVRLTCPIHSPRCVGQQEPPAGTGCDTLVD